MMAAALGLVVLDTQFPRVAGDVGNPDTFAFPVLYETLTGIEPADAVRDAVDRAELVDAVADAAARLVARGARGIATSCGFLAILQRELAARCTVPVATSSLLQVPIVERLLPAGSRVGIVTAEARSLSRAHLDAVGVAPDTPIAGMPEGGSFARTFLENRSEYDRRAVQDEVIAAGRALVADNPAVRAIVLECTNLPPYARALYEAVGLPVYDVRSFLIWFQAGLQPDRPIGGIA